MHYKGLYNIRDAISATCQRWWVNHWVTEGRWLRLPAFIPHTQIRKQLKEKEREKGGTDNSKTDAFRCSRTLGKFSYSLGERRYADFFCYCALCCLWLAVRKSSFYQVICHPKMLFLKILYLLPGNRGPGTETKHLLKRISYWVCILWIWVV